jgi:hypothetical protein
LTKNDTQQLIDAAGIGTQTFPIIENHLEDSAHRSNTASKSILNTTPLKPVRLNAPAGSPPEQIIMTPKEIEMTAEILQQYLQNQSLQEWSNDPAESSPSFELKLPVLPQKKKTIQLEIPSPKWKKRNKELVKREAVEKYFNSTNAWYANEFRLRHRS